MVGFALHLDRVPFSTAKTKTRPALHLTDLQAIERDFAFIVDEEVEAAVLLNAAKGADKAFITEAFVFDVFSGKKAQEQMGAGKKSVALSVRIQPKDGNLTDADLEAISAAVVKKVSAATGAVLRGIQKKNFRTIPSVILTGGGRLVFQIRVRYTHKYRSNPYRWYRPGLKIKASITKGHQPRAEERHNRPPRPSKR